MQSLQEPLLRTEPEAHAVHVPAAAEQVRHLALVHATEQSVERILPAAAVVNLSGHEEHCLLVNQ